MTFKPVRFFFRQGRSSNPYGYAAGEWERRYEKVLVENENLIQYA